MPRAASNSSTMRKLSGKRKYNQTAWHDLGREAVASVAGEGRYRHPVRLPALLPIRKWSAAKLTVPRDLIGDSDFCVTYGDGVASIDITALLAFHRAHGRLATVTAVRPPGRFGALEITDDRVSAFPSGENGYINGGFFVLSPKVLDYIEGDEAVWEQEPMRTLARAGQLAAFRHNGFWQPMDTLREKKLLEALWESGQAE